ncbi:M23 family metallopeptidase [Desulfovibrio sp. OttesenSCG-928-O18]|nr:M23 family metallopeptidase [Desulfovibrio sp. OttesenSCG-928-O18]
MRFSIRLLLLSCLLCAAMQPFPAVAAEKQLEEYPPAVEVTVPPAVGDGTAFPCTVKAQSLSSVTVTFMKRTVTAQADAEGSASILLPVPLDHADGTVPLTWKAYFKTPEGARAMPANGTVSVTIRKKIYPAQHLTLESKYVTPDPALQERIASERKLLNQALTTRSAVRHWELPMLRPLSGKVTSWYGLRRILNGQPRNPHKGLDFRGAEGTPIACIADGTVVLTGDFYYPGQFVVVDHGLGVTSIYMHMSKIVATNGQPIKRGETVGLVGMTGRSTGPHLHLGLTVLGQTIDAFPLLGMTAEDKAAYKKAFSDAATQEARPAKKKPAAKKSGARKSGKKTTAKNKPAAPKATEKTQ